MVQDSISNISVIADSSIFGETDEGTQRTAYETEVLFYSCIKSGDTKQTEKMMSLLLSNSVIMGKLSDDELRQAKYWAVCCVTLGIRYAIAGGLDENEAFRFSDSTIMAIDKTTDKTQVFYNLQQACITLTQMVSQRKIKSTLPSHVKKCMLYIESHLSEKLSVQMLSKKFNVSADYLSASFKKATGENLSAYILRIRLEKAKMLLLQGNSASDVAYFLGFCSESYFIKCFREHYKVTPKRFSMQNL